MKTVTVCVPTVVSFWVFIIIIIIWSLTLSAGTKAFNFWANSLRTIIYSCTNFPLNFVSSLLILIQSLHISQAAIYVMYLKLMIRVFGSQYVNFSDSNVIWRVLFKLCGMNSCWNLDRIPLALLMTEEAYVDQITSNWM